MNALLSLLALSLSLVLHPCLSRATPLETPRPPTESVSPEESSPSNADTQIAVSLMQSFNEATESGHLSTFWQRWVAPLNVKRLAINSIRIFNMKVANEQNREHALNFIVLVPISRLVAAATGPLVGVTSYLAGATGEDAVSLGITGALIALPGIEPFCALIYFVPSVNESITRIRKRAYSRLSDIYATIQPPVEKTQSPSQQKSPDSPDSPVATDTRTPLQKRVYDYVSFVLPLDRLIHKRSNIDYRFSNTYGDIEAVWHRTRSFEGDLAHVYAEKMIFPSDFFNKKKEGTAPPFSEKIKKLPWNVRMALQEIRPLIARSQAEINAKRLPFYVEDVKRLADNDKIEITFKPRAVYPSTCEINLTKIKHIDPND